MHLAAESHVDRSITGARDFVETNVLGTFNMLEHARRFWSSLKADEKEPFRFLHVSTDEVYGSLGQEGLFHGGDPYDRVRLTRHPRPLPIIWRKPGPGPMVCRSSSPTAPTTTARTISRKNSSHS